MKKRPIVKISKKNPGAVWCFGFEKVFVSAAVTVFFQRF